MYRTCHLLYLESYMKLPQHLIYERKASISHNVYKGLIYERKASISHNVYKGLNSFKKILSLQKNLNRSGFPA